MELIFVFLLIFLFPRHIHHTSPSRWIVWNVGQGEWVTRVSADRCLHFDMGGEKMPREQVRRLCGDKENFAYFSHWDWDHVGFAKRIRGVLPHICLAKAPLGKTSRRKMALFDGWPACPKEDAVTIWTPPPLRTEKKKSANEQCQIFSIGKMLVPGDAPISEEKIFLKTNPKILTIKWLVLGHHGSRTSTSDELLSSMPHLQVAIASSREAKYGHPHPETKQRLKEHHIPLLTTEEWGNIEIY